MKTFPFMFLLVRNIHNRTSTVANSKKKKRESGRGRERESERERECVRRQG